MHHKCGFNEGEGTVTEGKCPYPCHQSVQFPPLPSAELDLSSFSARGEASCVKSLGLQPIRRRHQFTHSALAFLDRHIGEITEGVQRLFQQT